MQLTELITDNTETQDEFYSRTYYDGSSYSGGRVLVYPTSEALHNPAFKGKPEIWNTEQARRYVEKLEGDCEMAIDWKELDEGGSFIKLVNGQPKHLKLSNWRNQDKFKYDQGEKKGQLRFGICFDVLEEDHKVLPETKEWTVTAIKACAKLRPLIEKAEAKGAEHVIVSVLRAGEGKGTVYEINELADVPKADPQ